MASKKIGIVGAGLGGMSAAIRLAYDGHDVTIFEKNKSAGGKAGNLEFEGFRFDTGPSLLTMPFILEELFESVDENIDDYLSLHKLEILCKYFYPDGTILNAYSDTDKLANEIEKATSDSSRRVKEYLEYSKRIYDLTAELFLYKSFHEIGTFLNSSALATLFNLKDIDPFRTMHRANSSFFDDEKTIQLFDRYATYNGSNPFKAPATLNIIQHVEYNLGAFVPKGGIYSISTALQKLALKKGVKFEFNSVVESIIYESKKIKGIEVNGKQHKFDIVISNSDVNFTYETLLNDSNSKKAKKYKSLEPSTSALVFYWGVDGMVETLETHNIIFSGNYKKEFNDLFENKKCPDDPTIYIYISSKIHSSDAPQGKENWYVMINAPYNKGQDWEAEIKRSRKIIIDKIETLLKFSLSKNIINERILSPLDIEQKTMSYRGSLYGISSNDRYAAFMRQQNRSKDYRGLYFCGGSAHPGGGIPLVILSGKITADLISKYEK